MLLCRSTTREKVDVFVHSVNVRHELSLYLQKASLWDFSNTEL